MLATSRTGRAHPRYPLVPSRRIVPVVGAVYGAVVLTGLAALERRRDRGLVVALCAETAAVLTTALIAAPHRRLGGQRSERHLRRLLVADRVRTLAAVIGAIDASWTTSSARRSGTDGGCSRRRQTGYDDPSADLQRRQGPSERRHQPPPPPKEHPMRTQSATPDHSLLTPTWRARVVATAIALAAALSITPVLAPPADAATGTVAGAAIYTEVGCWSYGTPRHFALNVTVTPERGYSSQWIRTRVWVYSYSSRTWAPLPWTVQSSTYRVPAGITLQIPQNARAGYWAFATEAQWARGGAWTNSVTDNAPRYTQYTLGRLPVDYSPTCFV